MLRGSRWTRMLWRNASEAEPDDSGPLITGAGTEHEMGAPHGGIQRTGDAGGREPPRRGRRTASAVGRVAWIGVSAGADAVGALERVARALNKVCAFEKLVSRAEAYRESPVIDLIVKRYRFDRDWKEAEHSQ